MHHGKNYLQTTGVYICDFNLSYLPMRVGGNMDNGFFGEKQYEFNGEKGFFSGGAWCENMILGNKYTHPCQTMKQMRLTNAVNR